MLSERFGASPSLSLATKRPSPLPGGRCAIDGKIALRARIWGRGEAITALTDAPYADARDSVK